MLTRKMIIGMILSILFYVGVANGTTYYVDPNGSDDANGLTPGTAFATIQKGVNSSINGDTIIVAEGEYSGAGNRNIDFLGKAITVRSTNPNDWDVVAATVINCEGSRQSPRCGFIFDSGEDSDSVLEGFTIIKGYGKYIPFDMMYAGGAILCDGSGPTIRRCILKENMNDKTSTDTYGGAIACYQETTSGANPLIENCKIFDNKAYYGGGISVMGISSTIRNCMMWGNNANKGGGVDIYWSNNVDVNNCTIVNNSADNAGGGIYSYSSAETIMNCILWGNGDDLYDCSATYSCIEDGNAGMGNISSYPYFVDYDANDFHLTWNSPCINKGDPNGDYSGQTDIDGENRVINGRVDMGADELSTDPSVNLVKNPGFEDGNDATGVPLYWEEVGSCVSRSLDTTEKHSGEYSWKFTSDGGAKACGAYSDAIAVEYGKGYKLTGWIKRELGTEKIQLYWEEFNADGKSLGVHLFLDSYPGTTNWIKCGYFWEIEHENTKYIKIKFRGPYNTAGTVWWDDFSVLEYGKEFLPPYGWINEPNLVKSIDFGAADDDIPSKHGGIIWNASAMNDRCADPCDNNITYRELKPNDGYNFLRIKIPAFNVDPNYDENDPNDMNSLPLTPMLLEVMYKDIYGFKKPPKGKWEEIVVVSSNIGYIDLDPNYLITNTKERRYDLAHLGGWDDHRWKYLQLAFQKSYFQLLRAIDGVFEIRMYNNSGVNLPIDYVSLRKISNDEYEDLVNKQRDARGFYEAELPTDAPSPPVGYDDPNLTVFARDIMRPVYKHTKPGPNEPNSITAFSCWGEVEPLSFSIYSEAPNGVNDISITVSDLKYSQDSNFVIESANISIYHVIYDETRLGIGWNRLHDYTSIPYALKPDRLEEFDTLSVEPNTSERVWLKVQVPDEDENLPSGLYEGTVTIEREGEPNIIVPIDLTVYDIKLDGANHLNAIYHCPYTVVYSRDIDVAFEAYEQSGAGPYIGNWTHRVLAYKDVNESHNIDFNSTNFEKALDDMMDAGIIEAGDKVYMGISWWTWAGRAGGWEPIYTIVTGSDFNKNDPNLYFNLSDDSSDPNFVGAFKKLLGVYADIAKERDIKFIIQMADEPLNDPYKRIISDRFYQIIMQDYNYPDYLQIGVTYYPPCDEIVHIDPNKYKLPPELHCNLPPLTDLVDYKLWGISPPKDSTRSIYYGYSKHSNPNYHGHFGYYTTGHAHRRNPVYNRFLHGLYAFGSDATIIGAYAMLAGGGDKYNDFEACYNFRFPFTYPDWLLAYPTWSGEMLYTIGLEGMREGIKDAKYIATLKKLIAENSTNASAQAAQYYLDEVKSRIDPNFESAYYDQSTELGYYEVVLEDVSEVNDPNDFEAFTEVRKKLAEFIVLLKDGTYYAVWNKTQNKFYTTIQGGINDANEKDELLVARNTHYESIDFIGKTITLRSFEPNNWDVVENTIIDANGATQTVYFHTSEDANSVLSGLTISSSTYGVYCSSTSPTITRCVLSNNSSSGIYCTGGSPSITHNKICNNASYGISSSKSAPEIKNNWIYKNGDTGVRFHKQAPSAPIVRNNTIAYNTNKGISRVGNATAPDVTNCILWANGDELAGKNYSANYSCIKDCSDAGGTGNICGDANNPRFVDANSNDFHIDLHSSPCVDIGDPCGDYNGEVDIDGDKRVIGLCVDIGADEVLSPDAHWWKLDETSGEIAYNSIDDNNNGVYSSYDPNWVDGFFNGAVDLNGVDDYFSVSSLDRAYDENSVFTVAGWFKTDQSTGKQTIVGQWSQSWDAGQEYWGWQVLVEANKVAARFGDALNINDLTGTSDANDGEWHQFSLVRNGLNGVALYVDGQPERTAGKINFHTYDTKFRIGDGSYISSSGSPPQLKGGPFGGTIDDVMIFNRLLSAEEVEQLYESGL